MTAPVAGDPAGEAVGRLFEEHGDLIYQLGLRTCDNPDAAEDLVQETFLRALRSWDSFEGRARPSTWLYTIATRACRRLQRRRAGEPRRLEPLERLLPSGDERPVQIPSREDPEGDAVLALATDEARRAIGELPIGFRLPFVLKEVFDLSIEEISQVLDVKPATVKTRLHRARLRLRQTLAEALPTAPASPEDPHTDECLALLKAKQESLDRGTPFPVPPEELCQRCRGVFATLDLGREACHALEIGRMPRDLRRFVRRALETAGA